MQIICGVFGHNADTGVVNLHVFLPFCLEFEDEWEKIEQDATKDPREEDYRLKK